MLFAILLLIVLDQVYFRIDIFILYIYLTSLTVVNLLLIGYLSSLLSKFRSKYHLMHDFIFINNNN